MSEPKTAVIVGAGSIGGWLATLLHDGGMKVKLLARGATLEAVRRDGLVYEARGERRAFGLEASDDPAALGPADYVVISLKAQALPALAPRLAPLFGSDTALVSMMNGIPWWFLDGFGGPLQGAVLESVDPGGRLKAAWPASRVIGSVVHTSAATVSPGVVRLLGADKLTFGEALGGSSARMDELVRACRQAGMKTLIDPDIRLAIWAKLWGNMCMNPVSALTLAGSLRILDDPDVNRLCLDMMAEMAALGSRIGLDLGMTPQARMDITRRLGNLQTSMLRDALARRELELDALIGVLVEMADRLDQPVPQVRTVLGLARLLSQSLTAA